MLFCRKNQPSTMHLHICGQYILADRFLGNSGYLIECEVLSTFGCQSESTEDCLNLTLQWWH